MYQVEGPSVQAPRAHTLYGLDRFTPLPSDLAYNHAKINLPADVTSVVINIPR